MIELSPNRTRLISDEHAALAIACYRGEVVDGKFVGRHAGCFGDPGAARAWLNGIGEPDLKLEYSE